MQIICYNITLYMRMILYTLCTVVFHRNGQYSCILCCLHTAKLRLWTRCKFMQTEDANCRLKVKCRQGANAE